MGVLAGARPVGHAEMTMFMRLLRATAQKHGLCILVRVSCFPLLPFPLHNLCSREGRGGGQAQY